MRHLEVLRHFLTLRKEQWYDPERLEQLQNQKLQKILGCASKTSYYGSISANPEDLEEIPITTKTDIRKNTEKFLTGPKNSFEKKSTSGSTGMPLDIFFDKETSYYISAIAAFIQIEFGRSPFDLYAEVSPRTPPGFPLASLGLFRKIHFSIFEDEVKIYEKLKQAKPDLLGWYPVTIGMIAKLNDRDGNPIRLKSVYSGTETLTKSNRKLIADSFSCSVFEQYGTIEFGSIAWECPEEHNLHVNTNSCLVEIVDEKGKPKKSGTGRIIITGLINKAMPLIRYSVEDLASWGKECPCGRGLPTFRSFEGREDDLIVLPGGKIRSARPINQLDDLTEILKYQIIQEKEDLFVVRYVPFNKEISESTKNEAISIIKRGCCGEEVKVELEKVEEIKKGRTGKIRTVISKVAGGKVG